jgi:hypothetical protein
LGLSAYGYARRSAATIQKDLLFLCGLIGIPSGWPGTAGRLGTYRIG